MTTEAHCPRCADMSTHRHCDRCGNRVEFPPFHCRDCTRTLCPACVQLGCCEEKPALEWYDDLQLGLIPCLTP